MSTALTPFPIKQSEFPMFKALSGGLAALALTAALGWTMARRASR